MGNKYDYRQLREFINANHARFSELNYDTSLSSTQKMNSLVEWFKVLLKEYDEWVKYLDNFKERFDEKLYTSVDDILLKWLEDGILSELIRETANEEVYDSRTNKNTNTKYDTLGKRLDEENKAIQTNLTTNNISINNINSTLTNKVDKNGNEQITLRNLSQEVKNAMTGGSFPAVGANSVNTTNIVDTAVTNAKLGDSYAFSGQIASGVSVNTIVKEGVWLIQNGALDVPSNIRAITHLINHNVNNRWFYQTLVYYNSTNQITNMWARRFDINNLPYPQWTETFNSSIKYRQQPLPLIDGDANVIDENDDYFVSTLANKPEEALAAGFLKNYFTNDNFKLQEFFDRSGNFHYRFLDLLSQPDISKIKFKRVLTTDDIESVALDKPLIGKKIVNFGDSIVGNKTAPYDMSTTIQNITGGTTYNVGFGGCRMAYGKYPRPWEAFSMIGLSEAIVSGDWSAQDTAIADTSQGYPAYFPNHLAKLKGLDFNTVDYITIRYGRNDWNADVELDNQLNKYDLQTYGGSLRKSLEILMEKYPHLRVLIQTQGYCFFLNETGEFINDGDDKENSHGQTIVDFVELTKEIARDYKTPCQDDYYDLGFNKFNRSAYFDGLDGTHPNNLGTKILGEKTARTLINRV